MSNQPPINEEPSRPPTEEDLNRLQVLAALSDGCISRRMPRMQVYLPEPLYAQVKARGLPVSELLQKAVLAELRRLDLLAETDRYLTDLIAEVGAPSTAQRARAAAVARRLSRRPARDTG